MYKDIFESIRNEAEKRNLRERTIMQKIFLLPNVWKAGLLKLTITIGLQSNSYIKRF